MGLSPQDSRAPRWWMYGLGGSKALGQVATSALDRKVLESKARYAPNMTELEDLF